MRNSYEVRAQRFVQEIDEYINDCEYYYEFEQAVKAFNYKNSRKVKFSYGSTRVVFITSDYVIKMNFGDRYRLIQFGDCEHEYEMYKQAEKDNMDYLFAKVTPYEFNGTTYYIMPRIYNIHRYDYDANFFMTSEEEKWCYDHGLFDLHCYNYGWKNDHIIIIDYAAFYENED